MVSRMIVPLYNCDLIKLAEASAAAPYLGSDVISYKWADKLEAINLGRMSKYRERTP